jgi:hypothetical protein
MDFQKLYSQHRAIVRLTSRVIGLTNELHTREDAIEVRLVLERLDRVLGLHLEIEDLELMPALMASAGPGARAVIADCMEDVGGVSEAWRDHLAVWSVDSIHREPERFRAATGSLMEALAHRCDREERELYPLAGATVDLAA